LKTSALLDTAYCKREEVKANGAKEDWWFKFDDSRVSAMQPDDIESPSAYVLFFKQRD